MSTCQGERQGQDSIQPGSINVWLLVVGRSGATNQPHCVVNFLNTEHFGLPKTVLDIQIYIP